MTTSSQPTPLSGQLRRRWPLVVAVAALLAVVWGLRRYQEYRLYRGQTLETERLSRQAVQVKVYRVRPQDVSGTLKRIGTIRARAETNLQFGTPGRVTVFPIEKGQYVKKGALIASLDQAEAKNALDMAELELEKASGKYFKDRTVDRFTYEQAKARYNQARLEHGKTLIRASHDGYLVEKWVNVGEHVDPGTVIGKLMDKSRVTIEMDLSEDDIQFLKNGQSVKITVDAVPGLEPEGTVSSITPYLKGDTRSFSVKVDLPKNPDEKLSPGMFARCAVRRYEKAGALTVPLEAGAEMKDNSMRLFVVGPDKLARARTVDVLFMGEGVVEVGGLADGDLVVLNPGADLQEGATVDVRGVFDPQAHEPPAASPAEGPPPGN